ncbi:MAG: rhomboid family intramembrane serine protease [Nitrososphaerota archaeon]
MHIILRDKRPEVTYILIILNIMVFFLMYLFGREKVIASFGVIPKYLIEDADIISLITSMFIHADFLHLFFNMWALFIFGRDVELVFGKSRYLLLYFISGIVGGIVYAYYGYYFSASPYGKLIPAVGASGAIFGLMASFAVLFPHRPLAVFFYFIPIVAPAYVVIGIITLIQTMLALLMPFSSIAYTAHVGGFAAGYIISRYYKLRYQRFYYVYDW